MHVTACIHCICIHKIHNTTYSASIALSTSISTSTHNSSYFYAGDMSSFSLSKAIAKSIPGGYLKVIAAGKESVRGMSGIIKNRRDGTGNEGSMRHVNTIGESKVRTDIMPTCTGARVQVPTTIITFTILPVTQN